MINMITGEEARENVREHDSCAMLHLDSDNKDINAGRIYKLADEAIRQVSSDGLSCVEIIMDSEKPFGDILDIHKMLSLFKKYGYIAVFHREHEEISLGVVVKYVWSLEIMW